MKLPLVVAGMVVLSLISPACRRTSDEKPKLPPIVGTWLVKAPEAPFPYHMFIFNSDGTMQQTNPDAGDPITSDSNGMGAWVQDGDRIKGKFVEVMADRATHQFISRGEISFVVTVNGNAFSGTASALFYDADGRRLRGPVAATLEGQRVVP